MNDQLQTILTIVTVVPALAWFVNSGIQISKLYKKHEDKIKEVTMEGAETIKQGAEKIKETVEKKVEEVKNPKPSSNDEPQPGASDSSEQH